ncbi:MAG: glycosyltransferase family protein [Burkholderiales bacterium]|nr:glycosyltransferase family protein [Burkholderiales bacterium]
MSWLKGFFGRAESAAAAAKTPPDPAAPSQPGPWLAQRERALEAGDLAGAALAFEQGIASRPQDAALRLGLGRTLLELGQSAAAADRLRQALALRRPGDGWAPEQAHLLLGRALAQLDVLPEAFQHLETAARLQPDHVDALEEGARTLYRLQRHEEAVQWADRLLQLKPDNVNGWLLRHLALVRLNRFDEALAAIDRALELAGPHPTLLVNRAEPLERTGRLDDALAAVDQALALDPSHGEARGNRVAVLLGLRKVNEAVAAAEEALRERPDDANLHTMLGIGLLLLGDLRRGWSEHEWRTRSAAFRQQEQLRLGHPRWQGESLEGRTIFLHTEQGFGDSIQFLRFVPEVARRARTVLLLVKEGLEPLLAGALPANCRVLPQHSVLPPIDFHCPLMSVPAVLGTNLDTLPAEVPYLRARPTAVQSWRTRLGAGAFHVGIAWSGNANHPNDRNRSMPLGEMRALGDVEGCRFFALQPQMRPGDREVLAQWQGAVDCGSDLKDFADTAALIEALDLVVTVDTSVAHLAGALGKPVWILLPYAPDWRWMLERSDSPWYPTARLYRQAVPGDWASVTEQVRRDLGALVAAR